MRCKKEDILSILASDVYEDLRRNQLAKSVPVDDLVWGIINPSTETHPVNGIKWDLAAEVDESMRLRI